MKTGVALLVAFLGFAVAAIGSLELVLVNGAVVRGEWVRTGEDGVELSVEGVSRVIPWTMISMADRYRMDGHFRAHFAAILAGQNVPAFAGDSDERFREWSVEAIPAPEVDEVEVELPVWAFRAPRGVGATSLPGWTEGAMLKGWVVQYGPDRDQVAVVSLRDPDGEGLAQQVHVLDVQTGNAEVLRRYSRSGGVEPRLAFRRIGFRSRYESVRVDSDATFTLPDEGRGGLGVEVEIRLVRGRESVTLFLAGQPELMELKAGEWLPQPLLQPPFLRLTAKRAEEDVEVGVGLFMGRLGVFPQGNAPRMVRLTGLDVEGREVASLDVQLPEQPSYGREHVTGRMTNAGQVRRIEGRLFLGSMLGEAVGAVRVRGTVEQPGVAE
ncbi:MAG TPA: hypothetical protein PKE55_09040 [Kiritimatiellia bacterium]|nr:hypothetical protein [Kiritimatiellia bacterium]